MVGKVDVYQIVQERILAQLDAGVVPWRQPWNVDGAGGMPVNAVSKKRYRGVNVFLLPRLEDNRWLTYKQAQQLGGSVRKGEKSEVVVFWSFLESETEHDRVGRPKKIGFLRYYNVFNVSQCDGLKLPPVVAPVTKEIDIIEECEFLVQQYLNRDGQLKVGHGGTQAYYSPTMDAVQMPKRDSFESGTRYYSTMFHELTHSTGHSNRLDRHKEMEMHGFGSVGYGREELVAEFGAAYLCGLMKIDNDESVGQSASYIKGWSKVIKEDKKLVVSMAGKAQRAVDFIVGDTKVEVEENEEGE